MRVAVVCFAAIPALAFTALVQTNSRALDQNSGVHSINYKGGVSSAWIARKEPSSSTLALARAARISGDVVVRAYVAADGTVAELEAVSGHPLLIPAAMEALKQWRRKPQQLPEDSTRLVETMTLRFSWHPSEWVNSNFMGQPEVMKTASPTGSGP